MDTLQLRNEKAPAPEATPKDEAGDNPVDLTAKAADKVREIQAGESDLGPEYCLRLRVVGGGCSGFSYDLYFDLKQDGDLTFVSHGVNLIVDELSLQYLAGTSVDYIEGLQGAGFKFQNPNVKSTCGCGSSFSV
jgi:iron-sulfur cluster insertion protein